MKKSSNPGSCVVISPHTSAAHKPLVFAKGDRVIIERRDTEWPEFLWCIDEDGAGAWIPENYLDRNDEVGILNTVYSSVELKADKGERLSIIKSEAGWHWCRNSQGKLGWIPDRNVKSS